MSKTVDEKVVEMRFDNRQFESNIQTSLSTIGKLKRSLNLQGASKGLENVSEAARHCNMSGLTGAVETIHTKFSAFEVMAVTALANITNSAVNAGKRIVSALTIDPVKTGFEEYETQINAIQTILANTESKGSTLQDVNSALDELNRYADMTIYNFTEMTRNIGTFTAAGVDLDTSVSAIKGIANLAAVSGSTSQQASTAMYQLSQALAAGTVKLQDWNSVVNAGMGGQVFQDALKETARVHGIAIDQMIKEQGSFRETLSKGWITSEILTETLSKFTGDLSEAQLKQMGYTDEQVDSIIKMGQTANDAATKVKTLTQLFDTLKEAAQSGWTKTWQLIVGDFSEAKELFTGISDALSEFINASSDRRNNLLEGALLSNWGKLVAKINEAGIETKTFEERLKDTVTSHGLDVDKLVEQNGSLEKAFRNGSISSDILKEAINNLKAGMVDLSGVERELNKWDTGEDVKKIQEALRNMGLDIGKTGVDGILGPATQEAIKAFQELKGIESTGIVDDTTLNALKEATTQTNKLTGDVDKLVDGVTELGGREKLIESFKNIFKALGDVVKPVKEAFREVFPPATSEQLSGLIDRFHSFTGNLKISEETADKLKRTFKGVFSVVDLFKKGIIALAAPIGKFIGSGGLNGIVDTLLNVTAFIGDFFTSLNESTGLGEFFSTLSNGIFDTFKNIMGSINPALGKIESLGDVFSGVKNVICDSAKGIFDVVKKVFTWITNNVSAGDVFAGLAGSGIFVAAKKMSGVLDTVKDSIKNLFKGGEASEIKERFSDLLDGVKDTLSSFTTNIKVKSLIGIAAAVGILSVALKSISEIEPDKIVKSLAAIGIMLGALSATLFGITKILSKSGSKGLIKAGASLILIAKAVKILADAMVKVSDLSWEEIGKGLTALGGGLIELSVALKILKGAKVSLSTSVAMMALAEACKTLGDALVKFSSLSWDEIERGLAAMGGALGELTASLSALSKVGGFGSLLGGTGILVAVQSLDEISENLERLGNLSWDEIERGLAAMGGALGEFTVALSALSKVGGFGSLLGGTGILVAVQSLDEISENLKKLGSMTWEEIGRGLAAMGGALGEFTIALSSLSVVGGFGSLLGGTGILVAVQSLDEISENLERFASMSWEEIEKGLVGMGGTLAELGTVIGVLGTLSGFDGVLGGGAILLGTQGLGDLADALKKFGSMSWEEIEKGLVGMGGALTELGIVSGLLGTLGGLGALVGSGSLLLGIQGLGDLADALKKFGTMDWDEIGRGLAAMGGALGETALGGLLNTFSGFGAAAIAKMAAPLGDLAESVKKWSGVTVPDGLGTQLGSLAKGVVAFNFSGWGADAIAALANPLGNLAASISKWSGIKVPDDISTGLTSLASGVKEFNFSGWGADAISELAAPLGDLAESLSKWSAVTVPENIDTSLSALANGVNAWSYVDTYNLSAVMEPLSLFAASIEKWNGVSISSSLQSGLEGLAKGIGACNDVSTENLSSVCAGIAEIGQAVSNLSSIDFSEASSSLSSFAEAISSVNVSTDKFINLGTDIIRSFTTALSKGVGKASTAGTNLVKAVSFGMKSAIPFVSGSANSVAESGVNKMNTYYVKYYNTGGYLVSGFVAGIRNKISEAADAAASMAEKASLAARDKLKVKSPSRVFYGIGGFAGMGFINALMDYRDASYNAGSQIALSARNGLQKTISKIADTVTNGMNGTPTIRPVLDLSSIKAEAGQIEGLLGMGHSIGITGNIGAISSMMNHRKNAASNDDIISAIGRLSKVLGSKSGDSYVVNGVTYDDGSNVAGAVKSLIRAAKVARRV